MMITFMSNGMGSGFKPFADINPKRSAGSSTVIDALYPKRLSLPESSSGEIMSSTAKLIWFSLKNFFWGKFIPLQFS